MRIPIATTIICSALSTFAFYQGFAALFSSTANPDDDDLTANDNQEAATEQAKAKTNPAIAKPETIAAKTQTARAKAERAKKAKPQLVASNRTASGDNLPTVNVPPTIARSPSALDGERSLTSSGSATQSSSSVAPPETIASSQTSSADTNQPLPFTASTAPLLDVKGHWAQSYIESLANKGVVRGFIDGNFHPDEPVTAYQFTTMAQKAFTTSPVSYSDLQQLKRDRVPTRADAAALIYQTLARAESTPTATAVQVNGAVPRPGIYTMSKGRQADSIPETGLPTVTRAIQRAGGALTGANLRQVQIHRIDETTARQVINVDVQQMLQTGDRSRDLVLQQGDKLYIPAATATAVNNSQSSALPTPEPTVSLVERGK